MKTNFITELMREIEEAENSVLARGAPLPERPGKSASVPQLRAHLSNLRSILSPTTPEGKPSTAAAPALRPRVKAADGVTYELSQETVNALATRLDSLSGDGTAKDLLSTVDAAWREKIPAAGKLPLTAQVTALADAINTRIAELPRRPQLPDEGIGELTARLQSEQKKNADLEEELKTHREREAALAEYRKCEFAAKAGIVAPAMRNVHEKGAEMDETPTSAATPQSRLATIFNKAKP